MTVGSRLCAAAVASASLALAPAALAADGPERLCPSDTDVPYRVKTDDTLWVIAARHYCLSEWPPLYFAWKTLAEYNRVDIGRNPDLIYAGTVVCLPEHISRDKWGADRCAGAPDASSSGPSACGNGRREGREICDGGDIGGLTCEMLDLPPGRLACRSDCKGFETAECLKGLGQKGAPSSLERGPAPCAAQCCCGGPQCGSARGEDEPPRKPEPKKPLVIKVGAELVGGVALPLTRELHDYIYRLLGVVGLGARVTIGAVEIAPRAYALYGQHGTNFDDIEQEQEIVGGGLLVQVGFPFNFDAFQVTPGVEVGWLYMKRTIELTDYPFAGQIETQTGHLPVAGVFVRPAYSFGPKRRWSAALDLSADLVLTRLGDNSVSTNFSTKLLGGIGYAF